MKKKKQQNCIFNVFVCVPSTCVSASINHQWVKNWLAYKYIYWTEGSRFFHLVFQWKPTTNNKNNNQIIACSCRTVFRVCTCTRVLPTVFLTICRRNGAGSPKIVFSYHYFAISFQINAEYRDFQLFSIVTD